MLLTLTVLQDHPVPSQSLSIRVEANNEPSRLLLSDDGRMLYGFSPFRRASLPYGRWIEGDGLFYGGRPGEVYTSNQASHLGHGTWMASFRPVGSPGPDRALLALRERGANIAVQGPRRFLVLVRYERRGAGSNPSVDIPGEPLWSRGLGGGAYQIACRSRKGLILLRADTQGDRLTLRRERTVSKREPPDFPSEAGGARSPGGRVALPREGEGGRFMVREWAGGRWRTMPHPITELAGRKAPLRLLYVGERLFAVPYNPGEASWTYEALSSRTGWRRISDRTLLTVSANGRFALTVDPRTGEAWLERLADLPGKG